MTDPPAEDRHRWYWSAALFKAVHPGRARRRHLWERTVFLVRAADDEQAHQLAVELARAKEHEYTGSGGELVRWVFVELENVQSLHDPLGSGAEVYWEHFERVDPPPPGSGGGAASARATEPAGAPPRSRTPE